MEPGTDRLQAVLPLTQRDLERAQILFRSLEWFFPELDAVWVISPDAQVEAIRAGVPGKLCRVRPESEVVPHLTTYRRLFRGTWLLRGRPDGWYVQQLAKLAAAEWVETPHYLTLDSDVFLVRRVRVSDLVVGGRSACVRYKGDEHPDWYVWAQRVLQLPAALWSHGVTPLLYSAEGMRLLHRFLEAQSSAPLRLLAAPWASGTANPVTGWSAYLLRNLPWAEQTLYHVFLERHDLYDRFHFDIRDRAICDRGVWSPGAFEGWDPAPAFAEDGPFFSIVQSWLRIPPEQVWRRVEPFMESARSRAGTREP